MRLLIAPATALALVSFSLPACQMHKHEEGHHEHHKIVATSPKAKDVTITQQYVCQIRSRRNIEVRALQEGYLEEVPVKEGQAVKQGEVMFRVMPVLYKTRLDAELAEARLAELERNNTERLHKQGVVSIQELQLYEAKMAKAVARAKQAEAELQFTEVRAPFDGIIDRLSQQQGSLVKKEEVLTTLSDNGVMWVYFNVPEARYLEFKSHQGKSSDSSQLKLVDSRIELVLADGKTFDQDAGDTVTIEGKFNNETGNIAFRADFPNPHRLLRHGQTGTMRIHRAVKDTLVIPQRATFEILDKRYVYVLDKDNVAHQRPITIQHELEDVFVIGSGLDLNDRIILEGVQHVHDGHKVDDVEFEKPDEALSHQKHHAE